MRFPPVGRSVYVNKAIWLIKASPLAVTLVRNHTDRVYPTRLITVAYYGVLQDTWKGENLANLYILNPYLRLLDPACVETLKRVSKVESSDDR